MVLHKLNCHPVKRYFLTVLTNDENCLDDDVDDDGGLLALLTLDLDRLVSVGDVRDDLGHVLAVLAVGSGGGLIVSKVARWQNLIPSFPWIAPGWRGIGAQSKERKGSNFAA